MVSLLVGFQRILSSSHSSGGSLLKNCESERPRWTQICGRHVEADVWASLGAWSLIRPMAGGRIIRYDPHAYKVRNSSHFTLLSLRTAPKSISHNLLIQLGRPLIAEFVRLYYSQCLSMKPPKVLNDCSARDCQLHSFSRVVCGTTK